MYGPSLSLAPSTQREAKPCEFPEVGAGWWSTEGSVYGVGSQRKQVRLSSSQSLTSPT